MNRSLKWVALLVVGVCSLTRAQDTPDLPAVKLHFKDVEPRTVFDSLATQAKLKLQSADWVWNNPKLAKRISIDLESPNFWLTAKALFEKTGVRAHLYGEQLGVSLEDRWAWGRRPFDSNGAVVLVAETINRTDNLLPAKPAMLRDDLIVAVHAYIDPRVKAIPINKELQVDEASDEDGVSIVWPPDERGHFIPFAIDSDNEVWRLQASLTYPASSLGTRIATLKVSASFLIDTQTDNFTFDDPIHADRQTKVVNGFVVNIPPIAKDDTGYYTRITMALGDHTYPEFEAARQNLENWFGRIRLTDKDGKTYDRSTRGSGGSGSELYFELHFEPPSNPQDSRPVVLGPPVKMQWPIPVETREIKVPFSFSDLPIPGQ